MGGRGAGAVNDRIKEWVQQLSEPAVPVAEIRRPSRALARSLLNCAEPVDSAVRQTIDDALGRGSTDSVLHAAALWLAYSAGEDLCLGRSNARSWIPGLHELIDSNHLDAAAYALPRLQAAFPQKPYLESMACVFRNLPPAVDHGRAAFVDDRNSDVQIIMAPGADTVMIAFCGAAHQLGISLNLLDRWFARLGTHVIYLRDRQQIGYSGGIGALGPDMPTTIESLAKLLNDMGTPRVVCLGNSSGASGALRYGSALQAERVLALSPITGGRKYTKKTAPHLPPGGVQWWGDLLPLYRDGAGVRAHIMFGEKNAGDRQQCLRMAGVPGVTVEALPDWESHHLLVGLFRAGRFEQLLRWLTFHEDVACPDQLTSTAQEGSL